MKKQLEAAPSDFTPTRIAQTARNDVINSNDRLEIPSLFGIGTRVPKSHYRVVVMGAAGVGKSCIISSVSLVNSISSGVRVGIVSTACHGTPFGAAVALRKCIHSMFYLSLLTSTLSILA